MPEAYRDLVNRVMRDHEGYTGDGQGGDGDLPVGDRSTARKPISKRDLREAILAGADATEGAQEAAAQAAAARDAAADYAGSATGTPQFASRASAEAATVPAFANWIIVSGLIYKRDAAGTALTTAGGVRWSNVPTVGGVDARQFGVGAGNPDNSAAFMAAYSAVVALGGGTILLPDETMMFRSEMNIYRPSSPRFDVVIKGSSHMMCRITCGFYGADKALFKCVDPAGVSRASPTWFENVRFQNESTSGGVNPVFFDIAGWGNSHLHGCLFSSSNNTQIRAGSIQNLRSTKTEFWYGGYAFPSKSTASVTFAISGTTLTASAPFFDARDRYITIFHPTARRRYRIASFTSSTQVELQSSGYRISTGSNLTGLMDCPRVSMQAGSNLVYGIDGDQIFVPGDVGRTVLIPRAREGNVAGANRMLRGRIIEYVSPHAVRIGDDWGAVINADRDVTNAQIGCPAIDFYQPRKAGVLGSLQSDLMMSQLHVEHYAGVGIFAETTDTWYIDGKLHGETNPTRTRYSLAAIWGNNLGGEYTGGLDSNCATGEGMAYFSDQAKVFRFRSLWARNAINERIVVAEAFPNASGYVLLDGVDCQYYAGSPLDLISDPNVPYRVLLIGFLNMGDDSQPSEFRLGHGSYVDHRHLKIDPGRLLLGQTVDAGSLPNGSIGMSATGALIYRDPSGVLRTISTTIV